MIGETTTSHLTPSRLNPLADLAFHLGREGIAAMLSQSGAHLLRPEIDGRMRDDVGFLVFLVILVNWPIVKFSAPLFFIYDCHGCWDTVSGFLSLLPISDQLPRVMIICEREQQCVSRLTSWCWCSFLQRCQSDLLPITDFPVGEEDGRDNIPTVHGTHTTTEEPRTACAT